jgi:glycosyltransferase involved in cell wall biosynthesis
MDVKILFVINQISEWRGDSGLVWYSAKFLKNKGHEVSIVTTDGNPSKNKNEDLEYLTILKKLSNENNEPVLINNIPIYSTHCTIESFGMYAPNAKNLAKKIVKNFDIIHIYSWYHHIGIEFFKIAKSSGIPLVASLMGALQPEAHNFHKHKKSLVDFLYTKKMLSYASALHSVGDSENDMYLKFGVDPKKIHKIENGINLEDFKLKNESDILKKNCIDEKPYILFLGRINEKKGLELLLDSFKILKNTNQTIYLVISGTGDPEYVEQIKKHVKKLDLENWVIFTGLVSQDEKIILFKSAKLFSLISISDIHPRAIEEALTMGVPVVISKESDFPEVMEYNAGIIVNRESKLIADSFEKLLEDDSLLEELSKNAQKLIKENFLLENQITKFEQVYSSLIH